MRTFKQQEMGWKLFGDVLDHFSDPFCVLRTIFVLNSNLFEGNFALQTCRLITSPPPQNDYQNKLDNNFIPYAPRVSYQKFLQEPQPSVEWTD